MTGTSTALPPSPAAAPARPRGARRPRLPRWRWSTVVVVAVTALSTTLRWLVPLNIGGSAYDEAIYLRTARFLSHGDWFGPYDKFTLIKDPSYPAFIALMHTLGIPLKVGEHLTYLVACAAVAGCVWVTLHRRGAAVAAYVILALRPESFSRADSSVLRDGWFGSLGLLTLALAFLLARGLATGARTRHLAVRAAVTGLVTAAFLLCREEGTSFLPAVALALVVPPLAAWWRRRGRPDWRRLAIVGGSGVLALLIPFVVVSVGNHLAYGTWTINDQTGGPFARAFADWTRVEGGPIKPQQPINRAQRLAVYAISPAANQLRHTLDEEADVWLEGQCSTVQMDAGECDYSGAVIWAIRDAADTAGHFTSYQAMSDYFTEVDHDIVTACDDGRLSCRPRLPVSLQFVQGTQWGPFTDAFEGQWRDMTTDHYYTDLGDRLDPRPQDWALTKSMVAGLPSSPAGLPARLDRLDGDRWPYDLLISTYRPLLVLLIVVGGVGFLASAVGPRRRRSGLTWLGLAFGLAGLVRLAAISLVSAIEFPADPVRYELPTRLWLFAFGLLGTLLLLDRVPVLAAEVTAALRRRQERVEVLPVPVPVPEAVPVPDPVPVPEEVWEPLPGIAAEPAAAPVTEPLPVLVPAPRPADPAPAPDPRLAWTGMLHVTPATAAAPPGPPASRDWLTGELFTPWPTHDDTPAPVRAEGGEA